MKMSSLMRRRSGAHGLAEAEPTKQVPADGSAGIETDDRRFARQMRDHRVRHFGKQASLSVEVRCTEAAVSFWESGRRLPQRSTFLRICHALVENGATSREVASLRRAWEDAQVRKAPKRLVLPSFLITVGRP